MPTVGWHVQMQLNGGDDFAIHTRHYEFGRIGSNGPLDFAPVVAGVVQSERWNKADAGAAGYASMQNSGKRIDPGSEAGSIKDFDIRNSDPIFMQCKLDGCRWWIRHCF